MEEKSRYATKKKGKTEVQPLWNMEDIKAVIEWFEKKEDWDGYFITMLELLLGRRIGDTISMKWSDLYYENGKRKEAINTIVEQKTGKVTELPVSHMTYEAMDIYLSHVGIDPMEHYDEFLFKYEAKSAWVQRHDNPVYDNTDIEEWCRFLGKDFVEDRKQKILKDFEKQKEYKTLGGYLYYEVEWNDIVKWQSDEYRRKLKQAVAAIGITTPVSTHSLRKTLGYWTHKMHMFDPNCLLTLQKLFNHADLQTTMIYIGLIEEQKRRYLEDHGEFIKNVLAGKGDEIIKNMPVISLKSNDFGNVIMNVIKGMQDGKEAIEVYQIAIDMANEMRIA